MKSADGREEEMQMRNILGGGGVLDVLKWV